MTVLDRPAADRRLLIPLPLRAPEDASGCLRHEVSGKAFATTWQVVLHADGPVDREALTRRIQACLDRIDAEMSPFRSDSDLSRFNAATPGSFVPLPPMLLQVVRQALSVAALTDGAFDPALLDIVEAWGFGATSVAEGLPSPEVRAKLGRRRDWRALEWRADGLIRPEGVRIDLCGIAKGYAVDAVTQMLKTSTGVRSALVEVGGELKGFGVSASGQPYWVEIERADGLPQTVVGLYDMAVATSGDTRRFFIHEGVRLSHTMDGRTHAPVTSGISALSVFDTDCWRADALATALMVMGEDRAMQFAQTHAIACLMRRSDGRERLSPALEDWL